MPFGSYAPAEIVMEVALGNTVGMDIDVHIGLAVFFVNLFKAAKEVNTVIFFKTIGTQVIQDSLVALGNSVKSSTEGVVNGDSGVLCFALLIYFYARISRFEARRQDPASNIAPQTKAILLFPGDEGKIPADLPRLWATGIQAAALCPTVQVGLYIIFWLRADDDVSAQRKSRDSHHGHLGKVVFPSGHILLQQGIQRTGKELAQFHQFIQFRSCLPRFPKLKILVMYECLFLI